MTTYYTRQIRQARATDRDLSHVWKLFYLIQDVEVMHSWTEHKQERFTKLLLGRIEQMGDMPLSRVLGGYETLFNNCADPSMDTLEFKPEIKRGLELIERERKGQPLVNWQPPESTPVVEKGESLECWLAVEVKTKSFSKEDGKPQEAGTRIVTFISQFVNKPVVVDDNGDTDTDDYLVSVDGDPWSAVGWHSIKNHADFDDYYEPLAFSDSYKLLGWAYYTPPAFTGMK